MFLLEARIETWDLAGLNPNRVKWLAQLGWKASRAAAPADGPRRRYPILVAFLHQALLHHTDVAVELYDQCVWEYHSAAQKELKEFRQTMARSTNEKLRMFRALGQVLLDADHRRYRRPGGEFCPCPRGSPTGGRRRDGRIASAPP